MPITRWPQVEQHRRRSCHNLLSGRRRPANQPQVNREPAGETVIAKTCEAKE